MQQMYATLAGNRPLKVEPAVAINRLPDLSATLSADGKVVVLLAVNSGLRDAERRLDLTVFGDSAEEIETWTLHDRRHSGEPDAVNSFDDPERVAPDRSRFQAASGRFAYTFPALSVTVMQRRVSR